MRTSQSHPLYIDTLQVPGAEGRIGMAFCPGKRGDSVFGDAWHRDLGTDLDVIKNWGAAVVVTLMEKHEFTMLQVHDLPEQVRQKGMEWLHLPIPDLDAPRLEFESLWEEAGGRIRTLLSLGENVLLHCRGGLGRTGTVAALLLVEFGVAPPDAITLVRQARPGTLETRVQETYILHAQPRPWRRTPSHFAACLLGGAVGDALGAAVEFDRMSDIRRRFGAKGITAFAPCYGRLGAITDDTQMTLFTAEGLLRGHARFVKEGTSALVREEVLKAYWRWLKTQGESPLGVAKEAIGTGGLQDVAALHARRAPGNTCLSALRSGERGSRNDSLNDSKGCGAVMRSAPVGLFMQSPELLSFIPGDDVDEATFDLGCDLGALTHGHPSGYLPSGCLALIIGRIIDGDDLRTAIKVATERLKIRAGHFETLAAINQAVALADDPGHHPSPETVRTLGEGWVGEEALAMALYCALVAGKDFDRGLRLAVNHDGDSDSTGAITGNILGALLGSSAIAKHWLVDLELKEVIETMGSDLCFGQR